MNEAKLWIDVEDLFIYAAHHTRPTGIQRLEFELCRALADSPSAAHRVRFVRHTSPVEAFTTVSWSAIERLWIALTDERHGPAEDETGEQVKFANLAEHSATRRLVYRLPLEIRVPLLKSLRCQLDSLRLFGTALHACTRVTLRKLRRSPALADDTEHMVEQFDQHARPGDTLVALGSPWSDPDYGALGQRLRRERNLRFAVLIYDIVVLRRPEWCNPELIPVFDRWLRGVLPTCDIILTISNATARDVERFAAEQGLQMAKPPVTIPIGSGFSSQLGQASVDAVPRPTPQSPYALIVSTIEVRKNHVLLFHVWRRMLDEMPADAVPILVFAGRPGWLVEDLLQQMRNADMLGGKIVLFSSPTDRELEQLYRGCLFTLFPSFYEGWGLPVTESLAYGRPCLISNTTSLPEAGGTLARYFDPHDTTQAFEVIQATVKDLAGLREWQQRIEREFQSIPWSASATAILQTLDHRTDHG